MKLTINGMVVSRFEDLNLTVRHASLTSDFSVLVPFDPDNARDRDMLRPCARHRVTLDDDAGRRMFTGICTSGVYTDSAEPSLVALSGYSLPSVLEKASRAEGDPLQYDNLSLKEIVSQVVKPFGLEVAVDEAVDDVVNVPYSATVRDEMSVLEFLKEQARSKNVLLSHDGYGRVLLTRLQVGRKEPVTSSRRQRGDDQIPTEVIEETTVPVYKATHTFTGGMPGVTMTGTYDTQNMHDTITSLVQTNEADKQADGKGIVANPYCKDYCPKVLRQSGGKWSDSSYGARDELGTELETIRVALNINRWVWNGSTVRVNTLVSVQSRKLWLYSPKLFFADSVTYNIKSDSSTGTATMSLVLPEVYTKEVVTNIFL